MMINAQMMKNVQPKGCAEVSCKRMNAMYASKGPGRAGNREPMTAMIQMIAQRMMRRISMTKHNE